MGANGSTEAAALPYPPAWLPDATPELRELAASAVSAISAMDVEKFLAVRAPLPELEDTAWGPAWEQEAEGLTDYKAHAMAAAQSDLALNKLVYKCVPKRVPEAEFCER